MFFASELKAMNALSGAVGKPQPAFHRYSGPERRVELVGRANHCYPFYEHSICEVNLAVHNSLRTMFE